MGEAAAVAGRGQTAKCGHRITIFVIYSKVSIFFFVFSFLGCSYILLLVLGFLFGRFFLLFWGESDFLFFSGRNNFLELEAFSLNGSYSELYSNVLRRIRGLAFSKSRLAESLPIYTAFL